MRILFTFIGGQGHFEPLVPLAREAAAMGHTVAFGCGATMVPAVEEAGFTVFQLGRGGGDAPERLPLRPVDMMREEREFRERFAQGGAQARTPHTIGLCEAWQPDVLVCDETDFGGMVAAERLGVPHATVLVMAEGSFVRAEVLGGALDELRATQGLPPDPQLVMLRRHLVLSPFPPSFRNPYLPLADTGRNYCPAEPRTAKDPAPAWLYCVPARLTVYFTLGTIFNMESGDLFSRVLAGLTELPVNVVVTVGQHLDPAEVGPQPENVHVERYVAQALILPHCDLVVSHGGSGSVSGALLHGLPSVLIPMGADQPLNAARCAALGLARTLDPIAATPESVRSAVEEVLEDGSYRQAAERMRDEFVGLPGTAQAVRWVERLVVSA